MRVGDRVRARMRVRVRVPFGASGRYSKTSRYINFVCWWSQRQILQDESLYKLRCLVVTAADTPRRVAI